MNKQIFSFLKKSIVPILATMFFVVDRIFKAYALNGNFDSSINMIGDWLRLAFIPNYYIAFSLPLGGTALIVLTSIIILALLAYVFWLISKKPANFSQVMALTIIIFGAISNLLDRINYGYVIDYLDVKYFTILNFADIMISFGVIWLIVDNLKKK